MVLLIVLVLNVYKPVGLTPYGWHKQRQERRARRGPSGGASHVELSQADE